jgi:hypothetical protein
MIRSLFSVLFLLLNFVILLGQPLEIYQPLECTGEIPESFIVPSTQKYQGDILEIELLAQSRKDKKTLERFALKNNFVLDDLLQSGLVLFNDPVTQYLNDVTDQIMEANGLSTDVVNVYTLRSTAVNAFATDRGGIFVTLGMVAAIEDEAQLAFILCHELIHYMEGHNLDLFLESVRVDESTSRTSVLNESVFDEALIAKNRYSKELETEADENGLELFIRTDYSLETIPRVFDVLKYAYLPYKDTTVVKSFFDEAPFVFPDDYWLARTNPIQGEEEEADDSRSSHPNLAKRRTALDSAMAAIPARDPGEVYLVGQETFSKIQRIARMELPLLHLHNEDFADALYTTYLQLLNDPNDYFLRKIWLKTLYMQTKYTNDEDYYYGGSYEDVEGASHQFHFLLDTLPDPELTVWAMREAWKLKKELPEDREVQTITKDLFFELATYFTSLDSFLLDDSLKTAYWQYAFSDFVEDTAFVSAFERGQTAFDDYLDEIDYFYSMEGQRAQRKYEREVERKGYRLGIDRVVVVNPYYLKMDVRKEDNVEYIDTEEGQFDLRKLVEDVAEVSDLEVEMLDVTNLRSSEVDKFNDIRLLNEWFSEQIDHEDLTLTIGYRQNEIDAIAEKYGTDYFLWTGVISLREKKFAPGLVILLSALYPPALPLGILYALTPEHEMLYYKVLYDVRTGRNQVLKFEYLDRKDSQTMVKAHTYDAFQQIVNE